MHCMGWEGSRGGRPVMLDCYRVRDGTAMLLGRHQGHRRLRLAAFDPPPPPAPPLAAPRGELWPLAETHPAPVATTLDAALAAAAAYAAPAAPVAVTLDAPCLPHAHCSESLPLRCGRPPPWPVSPLLGMPRRCWCRRRGLGNAGRRAARPLSHLVDASL